MKRRFVIFSIVVASLLSPVVRAEGSLSDAQLNIIRTNCLSAQISLQHVQESDKLTRINLGNRYETMLRLMTNFNSRVAQNKVDAPNLITIASDYQNMWDTFRAEYTTYDDGLSALILLDCRNEPTSFYDQMSSLRAERNGLADKVKQFDGLLDQYQQGVNTVSQKQGNTQ